MKYEILKLSRIRLVLIITAIAVILAITTDMIIAHLLNHDIEPLEDLLRAAIIPLLIAPFISWYLVGLLFELDRLEKKMTLLATYDDLTGLLTRRSFFVSCDALHKYSIRNNKNYSVLSVDLDYFKKINDEFGHAGGDEVLKTFGKISNSLSRSNDIVARVGGEEFVFFLPNTNLKQAKEFSQRLYQKIQHTDVIVDKRCIKYTISTGIAINECIEDVELEEILKHSDKALYKAKNNGRNQIVMYES
jgi:diguanylate cyclase (GGDEF)-like protein